MARIQFETEPTGFAKVEAVSKYWGFIQEENKKHKSYVTDNDWKSWVAIDELISSKLSNIIDNFDLFRLTEEQNSALNEIIKRIEGAPRKTTEEFEQDLANKKAEMQKEASMKSRNEEIKVKRNWLHSFFRRG